MLRKLLIFILAAFLGIFIFKSVNSMVNIPLHDFDEAHRAEKAKRMKEYASFLVPLSGSPQDRSDLKIPVKENPTLYLYYHPERPPLFYWLMIASTSIFGTAEWVYRLPSFLMTILTMAIFIFFALKYEKSSFLALAIGLVSLITSVDLWLSSQYAQMDTTLTFFSFLTVMSAIYFVQSRKPLLLAVTGISLSLSILSKGQAAFILIFPLIYLLIVKKLKVRELIKLLGFASIVLIPWMILLHLFFGLDKVVAIFTNFAVYSAAVEFSHIHAPIYWYVRWWGDSLRPGWTLFLALLAVIVISKKIDWKRATLLVYILGGLTLFSLSVNKIWWYVLPLVPAIAYFIFLSTKDLIDKKSLNLSLIIALTSLPFFLQSSNKIALAYEAALVTLAVLLFKFSFKLADLIVKTVFTLAVFTSLALFLWRFPKIEPYHLNTKDVTMYFAGLKETKCLYYHDMPPETALFYSNAGEIIQFAPDKGLFGSCKNYLLTPVDLSQLDIPYSYKSISYNVKNQPVVFQKGTMKLIKLNPEIDP